MKVFLLVQLQQLEFFNLHTFKNKIILYIYHLFTTMKT